MRGYSRAGPPSGEHESGLVDRNLKGRYEEELADEIVVRKRTEIHGRQYLTKLVTEGSGYEIYV